jgi:acyl-coenzyme A synthetase/AMP-(fatty) acid ligase
VVAPIDVPARLSQLLTMDPGHPLLQYGGRWMTLGEVAASVARLDAVLSGAGVGPDAKVGLLVRNRPRHVAAIAALLSTRRCLVPVTSIQSDAATVADLERSGIAVLMADDEDWRRAGLLSGCGDLGVLGIALGDSSATPVAGTKLRRAIETAPGVGVLMPTSGTTGLPKRIPYTYDQLGGALGRVAAYSPATARSLGGPLKLRTGVVVATLTMAHVAGFWTVLQALNEGRPLALLDRFEPGAWADLVEEHRTAMAMIPPSTLAMVLDADVPAGKLRTLKAVVCGTAPLDPSIGERFTEKYGVPVLTAYGATEFPGGIVGWSLADYRQFHAAKARSAGRARPGIKIRIVDRETGAELAPEAEGLVAVFSPQATTPTEDGWVVTNDIGRLDADGFLYVVGRADDAINRGGFKIVPQVIEEILRTHPAVAEAAVVGLPDARLGQVPVAAVELRFPVSEQELLDWLRQRVAKYQVPVAIRAVDALPRTVSLKISKPGLRALLSHPRGGPSHA